MNSFWRQQPYFDQQGKLHIAPALTPAPRYAWVPTHQVTILTLFVPGKTRNQWLDALPYAVEELLAQPIEDMHLVPYQRDKDGQVTLVAVAKSQMQAWLSELDAHQLPHLQLIPDCFALGWAETLWHRAEAAYPNYTLVRTGRFTGFAVADSLLASTLELAEQTHESITATQLIALPLAEERTFGLRQGKFALVSQQGAQNLKMWRWPLVMSLLLVGVILGQSLWQTHQINQQITVYQQQTEALFRGLFPDVQRIVNIRVQTQTYLDQAQSAQSVNGPAALLISLEQVLANHAGLTPKRLDWQNKRLSVVLHASNTEQLETITQQLGQQHQARLQIQTVTSEQAEGVIHVSAE